jgi:hypothetical protein
VYRRGGSGALAKRGLEERRHWNFVEGEMLGGAAGALLPREEEAAVAVREAGGQIDAKSARVSSIQAGGPSNSA